MTTHMQASARQAAQLLAALAEPEGRADPYPLYDQLRALGPVVAAVMPGADRLVRARSAPWIADHLVVVEAGVPGGC